MLGRRRNFLYTSTSPRFYRYLCYLLVSCVVIVCLSDFLCFQRQLSPTYHVNHVLQPKKGMRAREASKGDCFGFRATLERLEKVAIGLDSTMRRRFQTYSNMVQHKTEDSNHDTNSLKVFRYNVVLMAYKRSGSSFVGQIFNRHQDVLYLYEPIYFIKALARHHGIYRTLRRHLLKIIFTCRFQENPYFVSQLSNSPFRQYSRPLSEKQSMCQKSSRNIDACKRLDVKSLIDICQSHQHVVLKSIRIEDLDELKHAGGPNIEDPWNILKIVHLVRDPRAIISSRARIDSEWLRKNWTVSDYQSNSRSLCTKIFKDLKSGTSRDYNGMYNVIRYEDIITHQECAINNLFKFTGLSKSDDVLNWLRNNSKNGHSAYAFSTNKNFTVAMNHWRKHNELSIIRIIEQECSVIMDLLGYTKVKDKTHLLDISKTLFIKNTCPNIFMTQNIRQRLSKIIKLDNKGML